jgi:thiol-disulfide isomerase/thioredoxin
MMTAREILLAGTCGGMAFLASSATGGLEAQPTNPAAAHVTNDGLLLHGATGWFNSPPLTESAVRGKVVLVDFWTYTCINWRRTLPYLRAWNEKYRDKGLVIVGVHSPEFSFEKDVGGIRRAVDEMRIDYSIAVDSDHAIWRAFNNEYWPALYFVDAQGRVRFRQFGEGSYQQAEMMIQELLMESGAVGVGAESATIHADGFEAAADWSDLLTPETYVGYDRAENVASYNEATFDTPHEYARPEPPQPQRMVAVWRVDCDG